MRGGALVELWNSCPALSCAALVLGSQKQLRMDLVQLCQDEKLGFCLQMLNVLCCVLLFIQLALRGLSRSSRALAGAHGLGCYLAACHLCSGLVSGLWRGP